MAAMGMKCWRLYFLSHGIWGRVDSPLPHRLVFPMTVYSQSTNRGLSWLGKYYQR